MRLFRYLWLLWVRRVAKNKYWTVLDYKTGSLVAFLNRREGLEYAVKHRADLLMNFWSYQYGWVSQTDSGVEDRD